MKRILAAGLFTLISACSHPIIGFDHRNNIEGDPIRQVHAFDEGECVIPVKGRRCAVIAHYDLCTRYIDRNGNGEYEADVDKVILKIKIKVNESAYHPCLYSGDTKLILGR
tara:strand:+ start:187 stop:519 length:333 start_codon:yes stop_codon:yes gene_type:complete